MYVHIGLLAGKTGQLVTTVTHWISKEKLIPGPSNSVTIEFTNINLRPGDYSLYFSLHNGKRQVLDVVDDLSVPLIISTDKNFDDLGYDPTRDAGFFDIKSRML